MQVMPHSELHIAIASDLNYLVHTATRMRSIIDNKKLLRSSKEKEKLRHVDDKTGEGGEAGI